MNIPYAVFFIANLDRFLNNYLGAIITLCKLSDSIRNANYGLTWFHIDIIIHSLIMWWFWVALYAELPKFDSWLRQKKKFSKNYFTIPNYSSFTLNCDNTNFKKKDSTGLKWTHWFIQQGVMNHICWICQGKIHLSA